jgi:hypothetical protein
MEKFIMIERNLTLWISTTELFIFSINRTNGYAIDDLLTCTSQVKLQLLSEAPSKSQFQLTDNYLQKSFSALINNGIFLSAFQIEIPTTSPRKSIFFQCFLP